MKLNIRLMNLIMLMGMGVAFAVNGTGYYNLVSLNVSQGGNNSTYVLTQDNASCNNVAWAMELDGVSYKADSYGYIINGFRSVGRCLGSVMDTPQNLYNLLDSLWITQKGMPLALGTDIDLGEYSQETPDDTCDVNHVPLPFLTNSRLSGKGHKISHLCYVTDSVMTQPVGLFESIEEDLVEDLVLQYIRIKVRGTSTLGADYYPVGALAGIVKMVTLEKITLVDDSIQAPFAGGLVGYAETSTIRKIQGDNDIHITNTVHVDSSYAGSKVVPGPFHDYQVFLGGLVGVANRTMNNDSSFADDSVKVRVYNYETGNKSALGGIAGFFSTTGETVGNLYVFNKYKANDETVPSIISGGSSMGGLFGVVTVVDNAEFLISNSFFDGQLLDASSPNTIAVGGLVGLDSVSTANRVPFTFLNSGAKVQIKDSLKTAGSFRYYAGGILGYGNSCPNNLGSEDDLVTMSGLNTSGSISIRASAQDVPGVHGDFFIGGLAGTACFAQKEGMGLLNDTSTVVISSKINTSFDESRKVNNEKVLDTIFVGGLVGLFNMGASSAADQLTNLSSRGMISVEDSLNHLYVGGAIGGYTAVDGSKYMSFNNVDVQSSIRVAFKNAKTETPASKQSAKIGGICGYCKEIQNMRYVSYFGNIKATGTYNGDSLLVGGLIGASNATEAKMKVNGAFVRGDVSIPASVVAKNVFYKVGYVMGFALIYKDYEFKSIYHYGANDVSLVPNPFGYFFDQMDRAPSWKTNAKFKYIIRNGPDSSVTANTYNGTFVETDMKKSAFAGLLNQAYEDDEELAWSYVSEKNSGFPIFAIDGNIPVVLEPDKYLVTFLDYNGKLYKQVYVTSGSTISELPTLPAIEGHTCTGWDGVLDSITTDITVKEVCSVNKYMVTFFDYKSDVIDSGRIKYMESAVPPQVSARTGYTFVGWNDSSFTCVKKDLKIHALYEAIKYHVTFVDYDDRQISVDINSYGSMPTPPVEVVRKSTAEYVFTFSGWSPELAMVAGDITYKAVYDSTKVQYQVVFEDGFGNVIGVPQMVDYGSAAVAPDAPEREGYLFKDWDRDYSSITGNLVVRARYELVASSSSSEEIEIGSSENSTSSSSSSDTVRIVNPLIEQSGNAIRLTFSTENANDEMEARVLVIGEKDTVVDTIVSKNVVDGGIWEMTPAPMGLFSVELIVGDMNYAAVFDSSFEVASEIVVEPRSWRMVSLFAMDKKTLKKDSDDSFYWWDEQNPIGDYWQYRSYTGGEVAATRGFWYGSSDGRPLVLLETSGNKNSEIVWELDSLYSGWNLVANPYGWYVDLSKGSTDDGSKVVFWKWNAATGNYVPMPTNLGPYEAIWAKVGKATTWRVSAAPTFSITETDIPKEKALHKDRVSGAWSLTATLADENGKIDSWNVIGAGTEENLDEPPAGMGDRVSLAIREIGTTGTKGAKLAKSIKPLAEDYRWILELSANSARDGELSFEGIAELKKLGLRLFLVDDGEVTELTDGKTVNLALTKKAKQVEVRVSASNVAVAAAKLGALQSARLGDQLQVQFNATESLAGAKASYAVAGIDGKVVASGRFTAISGSNHVMVNTPKPGIYFVKVRVGSQELSGKVLVQD